MKSLNQFFSYLKITGLEVFGLIVSIILFLLVLTLIVMGVIALGVWLANNMSKESSTTTLTTLGANGWEAQVKLVNNTTGLYFTVSGTGPGNTSSTIAPGSTYSWSSTETYNTKNILIYTDSSGSGTPLSQGNLSFGPTAGVYVDRGWMSSQTITLDAVANGKQFTQTTNGGTQLLAWNEFESGGDIELTYTGSA